MNKPLISFTVLLLSLGFMFLYVVPAYRLSQERRADVESLTKILSTSGEIKTLLDKTRTSLAGIDATGLSRFEVFIPEKVDPIRFANNIQYIGSKNKVILGDIAVEGSSDEGKGALAPSSTSAKQGLVNSISLGAQINKAEAPIGAEGAPASVESGKKFVATKANFSFSATYDTFQLFLNNLQSSLGVINVTSLSFSEEPAVAPTTKSKTQPVATYRFVMTIETYSLK